MMVEALSEQILFDMLKGGVDKLTRDSVGNSIATTLRTKLKIGAAKNKEALSSEDEKLVSQLNAIGFSETKPLFTNAQIDEIVTYFSAQPAIFYQLSAVAPEAVVAPFNQRPPGYRFCEWHQDIISGCPAFTAAAHDPRLLRIAETYLQAPPTITILTAWWSFPSDTPIGGMQEFHHDRDDFRCLKLFSYLTPVTPQTGPHEYVDGTHTARSVVGSREWPDNDEFAAFMKWMDVHRKDEEDVRKYFNKNIRTITGPRGATFLEDTRGLHRGVPPQTGPRLAFEICYSLLPKFNGFYAPIRRAPNVGLTALSSYATRLFYKG